MNFFFIVLFAVGLAYRWWKANNSNLIVKGIEAVISSQFSRLSTNDSDGLSKATRTASRTMIMDYSYKGSKYELTLPARSRAIGWQKCIAYVEGNPVDVTEIALRKAGPLKDFFGMHEKLKPHQIYRNADKLVFIDGGTFSTSSKVYFTIE